MTSIVLAGPGYRSLPAAVGANGTINGTVTRTSDSAAVPGGVVWLFQSGTYVTSATPDGSGVYSFTNVTPGSYTVFNNPPLAYSIADAGTFDISVSSGGTTTQNLSIKLTVYNSFDFQSPTTTAQLKATTIPPASTSPFYQYNGADAITVDDAGTEIALDTTGGPSSTKCMTYTWPNRSANDCTSGNHSYTIGLQCRAQFAASSGKSELWFRVTEKLSSDFRIGGGTGVCSCEYKHIFLDVGPKSIQCELDGPYTNAATTTQINIRLKQLGTPTGGGYTHAGIDHITDGIYPQANPDVVAKDYTPAAGALLNVWHSLIIGITGIGTTAATTTLYHYVPGSTPTIVEKINLLPADWLGSGVYPTINFVVQFGANINNGPNQAQTRSFREWGLYDSRPSLVSGVTG